MFQLYNVVVDDQVTGNKILNKGDLKRRVTIIPLNKISSRPIDAATAKRAEAVVSYFTMIHSGINTFVNLFFTHQTILKANTQVMKTIRSCFYPQLNSCFGTC